MTKAVQECKETTLDLSGRGFGDVEATAIAEQLKVIGLLLHVRVFVLMKSLLCSLSVILGGRPSPVAHPFRVMLLCR